MPIRPSTSATSRPSRLRWCRGAAILLALTAGAFAQDVPVAGPQPLIAFTAPFPYAFLEWKDQVTVQDGRLVLSNLSTKGVVNVPAVMDLAAKGDRSPALRLRVLPGNTTHGLGFRLLDAGGNNAGWIYELPPPGEAMQIVLPLHAAALAQPTLMESRKDGPPFALDRITGWKLVGDWQRGTVAVEIAEVLLVSPDSAMLAQRAAAAKAAAAKAAAKATQTPAAGPTTR